MSGQQPASGTSLEARLQEMEQKEARVRAMSTEEIAARLRELPAGPYPVERPLTKTDDLVERLLKWGPADDDAWDQVKGLDKARKEKKVLVKTLR